MNFNKVMKGGLAAVMACAMAACESAAPEASSAPAEGTAAPAAATSGYVPAGDLTSYTLGTLGPRSGETAVYGTAVTNGVILAVEDYNKANGTNIQVATDYMDTQGDQTQAVNLYNKLVGDVKVAGIVGATLSGESIAVAGATVDTGIPLMSPSATAAAFTNEGGSNIFRACYTDPQQASYIADFSFEELGAKTAAIIYNADDDYSTGLTDSFTAEFTSKGGEIVASESFGSADSDFSAQLTKIAAVGADVLFIPNYYQKDSMIAEQARSLGIESTFVGCDGWDGVLSTATDVTALEGAVFINQYSPDMESVQGIIAEYSERFGEEVNVFGINAYDAATLMMEGIANAGTLDPAAVCEAISSISYDGILGNVKFDSNGDSIKTPIYVTIKNGEYVQYGK